MAYSTMAQARISQYVAWPSVSVLGDATGWTPDHMPIQLSRKMQAAIEEAVDFEGPIELGRLSRVVAARFGVNRIHQSRYRQIACLIAEDRVQESKFGTFVWPAKLSPESYFDFRHSREAMREVAEIAPEELCNAMAYVVGFWKPMVATELAESVAKVFGIQQLTEEAMERLVFVADTGVASGRLSRSEGRFSTPFASTFWSRP